MTVSPEDLADRPATGGEAAAGQPLDLLSELLRTVRLSGERVTAHAPPPHFALDVAEVGSLLFIDEGELVLRIEGEPRDWQIRCGDVVLLPRGDRHQLSDVATAAGDQRPARWLSGTFAIGDPKASHLLRSLPAVIVLRGASGPALEGLQVARRMLVFEMEAPSQGSAVMVARILDLIFIQVLRLWAAGPEAEPTWMAGALDPHLGPALSAIHRDPGREWTVEDLARACNLSRSAFAARFLAQVGQPPATYLGHVRLDAATDLLRHSALPVGQIATKVGYTSEAAFSRAFKNRYGTPPARWRRDVRAPRS